MRLLVGASSADIMPVGLETTCMDQSVTLMATSFEV